MRFETKGDLLLVDGRPVPQIPSIFVGGRFARPPRFTVIHFTGGGSARSSAEWFRDRRNPGASAHVVIDRDGSVIQCVPLSRIAWHAGRSAWKGLSGLNAHSFGIELANWGTLRRSGDGWATPNGTPVPDPVIARHRNAPSSQPGGWEPFSAPQIATAAGVARAFAALGAAEIVGHDDIAPGRKADPGPAWDMAAFRLAVLGPAAKAA